MPKCLLFAILFLQVWKCQLVDPECSFGPGRVFPCNCDDPGEVCDGKTGACKVCKDGPPKRRGQWWKGHGCRMGNIAHNKVTTASSNRLGFGPELAVDGDVNPNVTAGSCFVADGDAEEAKWLMVDLGEPAAIFMITLYNRDGGATGLMHTYLNDFHLYVSNSSGIGAHTALCGGAATIQKTLSENIVCSPPIVGRYVSLKNGATAAGHHGFALCEIAVIGAYNPEFDECCSNPCLNGATCVDKLLDVECQCAQGFGGKFCQYLQSNCPAEWVPYEEGFTCYRDTANPENYDTASEVCAAYGGHLPIINSAGEKEFVTNFLASYNIESTWLQLQRNVSAFDCDGQDYDCYRLGWRWPDGSEYLYPDEDWWRRTPKTEPDKNDGLTLLRGAATSESGPGGRLIGFYTKSVAFRYLCEKEYEKEYYEPQTTTTASIATVDARVRADSHLDATSDKPAVTPSPRIRIKMPPKVRPRSPPKGNTDQQKTTSFPADADIESEEKDNDIRIDDGRTSGHSGPGRTNTILYAVGGTLMTLMLLAIIVAFIYLQNLKKVGGNKKSKGISKTSVLSKSAKD